MERDSLVIEIMDLSKDYVCKDCGSDQWHLNVVVKPNGSGGALIQIGKCIVQNVKHKQLAII